MSDKILGFYDCVFLELPELKELGPELKELGWEKSTKTTYSELRKESNFAILHDGNLEERDFAEAKSGAIFIRVSKGGQENLREKRGFKPKDDVYCLHVWNQQPLAADGVLEKLLNLTPDKAEQILSGNLDDLDEKLKLLFSMPANSDILCCWWMLCQAYFLYEDASKKKELFEKKVAWKLGLPDGIQSAKDQVEKDIDYMCESRGKTISEDGKNGLVKVCKCFIDTVTGESVFDIITDDTLTELQKQLKILFPTQGGQK